MHTPVVGTGPVPEDNQELVPLRVDFDVVLRGYDRAQVQRFVRAIEADNRVLSTDRDAALAQAQDLTGRLERLRNEVAYLQSTVDELCRKPPDVNNVNRRLRRMVELATVEAEETMRRGQAAAERIRQSAAESARQLRQRHQALVDEVDARREAMENEHREIMRAAQERIQRAEREAATRRQELDADAERARARARVELDREFATKRAAFEVELREHANRVRTKLADDTAQAREDLQVLQATRASIVAPLSAVRRNLAEALGIMSEETPAPRSAPDAARTPSGTEREALAVD
jgi:cell division septum initiation protein DivIVA